MKYLSNAQLSWHKYFLKNKERFTDNRFLAEEYPKAFIYVPKESRLVPDGQWNRFEDVVSLNENMNFWRENEFDNIGRYREEI